MQPRPAKKHHVSAPLVHVDEQLHPGGGEPGARHTEQLWQYVPDGHSLSFWHPGAGVGAAVGGCAVGVFVVGATVPCPCWPWPCPPCPCPCCPPPTPTDDGGGNPSGHAPLRHVPSTQHQSTVQSDGERQPRPTGHVHGERASRPHRPGCSSRHSPPQSTSVSPPLSRPSWHVLIVGLTEGELLGLRDGAMVGLALGLTLGLTEGHGITRQPAESPCVPRQLRVLPRVRYFVPGSQLLEHPLHALQPWKHPGFAQPGLHPCDSAHGPAGVWLVVPEHAVPRARYRVPLEHDP